jgi:hypothetical protein
MGCASRAMDGDATGHGDSAGHDVPAVSVDSTPGTDVPHSTSPVACNDGTGNTDCCPGDAEPGKPRNYDGPACYTPCSLGGRGHLGCGPPGRDGSRVWGTDVGIDICPPGPLFIDGGGMTSLTPGPCDDGTGLVDCCPPDLPGPFYQCAMEGATCWLRCSNGMRQRLICSPGPEVTAIHGTEPCSNDGGAADASVAD